MAQSKFIGKIKNKSITSQSQAKVKPADTVKQSRTLNKLVKTDMQKLDVHK